MAICCRVNYNIPLDKPVKVTQNKTRLDMNAYKRRGGKDELIPADDYFCGKSVMS